ncbi:DUF3006 domain-containing protein [Deinococcus roseus]|nr:DUF3006 domain-containing protein [Deinococcus roseus]
MAQWIVEGFEQDLVRLEFEDLVLDFPAMLLPEVRVGDVLRLHEDGGWFRFVVDQETTTKLKNEAQQALADLNKGAPEGDIQI